MDRWEITESGIGRILRLVAAQRKGKSELKDSACLSIFWTEQGYVWL